MITRLAVKIKQGNALFHLSYRKGLLFRIEKKNGTLTANQWSKIGAICPTNLQDLPKMETYWSGRVAYKELKKEPESLHQQFIAEWFSFYEKFAGFPHKKLTAKDGKAVKELIAYLSSLDGNPLVLFQQLLTNWALLDKFHQKNTNLTYINSKISNLLKDLKDANTKKAGKGVDAEFLHELSKNISGKGCATKPV